MFKQTITRHELERYFQFYGAEGVEAQDQIVIELRERGYAVHYSLHVKPNLSEARREYYRALKENMITQIEEMRVKKAITGVSLD